MMRIVVLGTILGSCSPAGTTKSNTVAKSSLKPPDATIEEVCSANCADIVGPDRECVAVNMNLDQSFEGTVIWEREPTLREYAEERAKNIFAIRSAEEFMKINRWDAAPDERIPFEKVFSMCYIQMKR